MLEEAGIGSLVDQLCHAARSGLPMRLPSVLHPGFALEDAYSVQEAWTARQVAAGRQPVGYKLGLTTPESRKKLDIDRPIYGVLFRDAQLGSGDTLALAPLIAPRAELELAFVMKARLADECSGQEALEAVEFVAPALEIIDNREAAVDPESGTSRNAMDIVADDGGASHFLLADTRFDPLQLDLATIEATLAGSDGRSDSGRFDAVFGSPEQALVELARELGRRGQAINPGDIVLCGSAIAPFPLAAETTLTADYGPLGKMTLRIK